MTARQVDEIKVNSAVLFLVDVSGSMTGKNMHNAIAAVDNTIQALLPDNLMVYVGCLVFDTAVSTLVPLQPTTQTATASVLAELKKYQCVGGTAIYDSLITSNQLLERFIRERGIQVANLVLLTDGDDNASSGAAVAQCREMDLRLQEICDVRRCIVTLELGRNMAAEKLKLANVEAYTSISTSLPFAEVVKKMVIETKVAAETAAAESVAKIKCSNCDSELKSTMSKINELEQSSQKFQLEVKQSMTCDPNLQKLRAMATLAKVEGTYSQLSSLEMSVYQAEIGLKESRQYIEGLASRLLSPGLAQFNQKLQATSYSEPSTRLHACQQDMQKTIKDLKSFLSTIQARELAEQEEERRRLESAKAVADAAAAKKLEEIRQRRAEKQECRDQVIKISSQVTTATSLVQDELAKIDVLLQEAKELTPWRLKRDPETGDAMFYQGTTISWAIPVQWNPQDLLRSQDKIAQLADTADILRTEVEKTLGVISGHIEAITSVEGSLKEEGNQDNIIFGFTTEVSAARQQAERQYQSVSGHGVSISRQNFEQERAANRDTIAEESHQQAKTLAAVVRCSEAFTNVERQRLAMEQEVENMKQELEGCPEDIQKLWREAMAIPENLKAVTLELQKLQNQVGELSTTGRRGGTAERKSEAVPGLSTQAGDMRRKCQQLLKTIKAKLAEFKASSAKPSFKADPNTKLRGNLRKDVADLEKNFKEATETADQVRADLKRCTRNLNTISKTLDDATLNQYQTETRTISEWEAQLQSLHHSAKQKLEVVKTTIAATNASLADLETAKQSLDESFQEIKQIQGSTQEAKASITALHKAISSHGGDEPVVAIHVNNPLADVKLRKALRNPETPQEDHVNHTRTNMHLVKCHVRAQQFLIARFPTHNRFPRVFNRE